MKAVLIFMFFAMPSGVAADPLSEPGTAVYVYAETVGAYDIKVPVYFHRPESWPAEDGRILLVMHGAGRNARSYRKAWIAAADKFNALLVVPEFGKDQFPKSSDYQQGGLYQRLVANMKPRTDWTISIVDRLIDDVFRRLVESPRPIYLYGHSGGGQFVHRYMMFGRAERIVRAVAANSGWYMMPDPDTRFPYGLLGTPYDPAALRNYLATPMIVLLGAADTRVTKSLRQSKRAMQQGPHRLARGRAFFDAGRRLAATLQVPFGWQLETVPGVGHSNSKMAPAAARILFR